MTHGALRRGVLRPGTGHWRGGQRPATSALPRKREWARLPRHLRRESPPPFVAPPRHSPSSFTLSVHVPRILASRGPGRSAWRAGGAPLMIVKKVLTAPRPSRCCAAAELLPAVLTPVAVVSPERLKLRNLSHVFRGDRMPARVSGAFRDGRHQTS
jgi:hypothetical protein